MEKYELSLYKPGSEPEEVSTEDIKRIKVVIPIMEINCGLGARSKSPGVDAMVNEDDLRRSNNNRIYFT